MPTSSGRHAVVQLVLKFQHMQMHENSLYNAKSIKEKVVKVCQQSKFALDQITPTKFASNQTIYFIRPQKNALPGSVPIKLVQVWSNYSK